MFGLKLLPVLLATVAFYLVGMVWYGFAFSEIWMRESGITEADFDGASPMWMALGPVISLLSVIGIAKVLQWTNASSIGDAIQRTLVIWVAFGLTMAMYALAYTPQHSLILFMIDAGHSLVGWSVAAAILAAMK